MKNVLLSTVAVLALTTSVYAGSVGGEVELSFVENNSGNYVGAMALDLDVKNAAGVVALGFTASPDSDLTLDTWTVGTTLGFATIAIGNDNGVFVGAEGEQTIASPAMTESIQITVDSAEVAVGFTDWNSDLTDISNIQGAYTVASDLADIKLAADYNFNTENTVVGAEVSDVELSIATLGAAITYDMNAEHFAYEWLATVAGLTAYVNGDQEDVLQNVGGEYIYNLGAVKLTSGVAYNFDSEDFNPTAAVTFSF